MLQDRVFLSISLEHPPISLSRFHSISVLFICLGAILAHGHTIGECNFQIPCVIAAVLEEDGKELLQSVDNVQWVKCRVGFVREGGDSDGDLEW